MYSQKSSCFSIIMSYNVLCLPIILVHTCTDYVYKLWILGVFIYTTILSVYTCIIHRQQLTGVTSSGIAHSTLVVPWFSPSHSQSVVVFSCCCVDHCLSEDVVSIISYFRAIQCPGDICSRTTSGGTGQSEHFRAQFIIYNATDSGYTCMGLV